MSILSRRRPFAYSKMDCEDPEEMRHRKAQFLIYKVLERADYGRKRSCLRVRICRVKIKIGKRLRRLRKTILLTISAAEVGAYKQLVTQYLKRLFRGGQAVVSLPKL
ncbi:uncharacterized protein LOC132270590 [Cornus florida]|uniref:uncharacterized protein LOC132270590 n=1 Tax=Cornus florida TaxID=4283 RepID=UPI0028A0AD3B|nr:uncharacterized protein LOC132270590 [Cornus florida]